MAGSESAMLAKTHAKRKSPHVISQDYPQSQEEVPVEGNCQKKIKLCKNWENLDLILTLQSNEIHLQEKIRASFDFARLEASEGDGRLQPVSFSRALHHVFDWTQSLLMFSDRNKKNSDFLDPSLDYRCWAVIKLCSEKFIGRACPNLFRAVTPVLKQALLLLDENFLLQGVYFELLFENVLQCFSSLVAVNSRAFYNVSLDLWISCASDVVNIVSRVSCREEQGSSVAKVLLNLSALLLEHFSNFLRFHTNPKNIFRIFVERLLEQLFELLVLLRLRAKDSCEQFTGMLKIVEDILLNGLFHPAHISGFLSSKSSTAGQVEKTIESKESYHRHLFRKLEKIIGERNVAILGGLSCLLRLFASKAKGQQGPSLSFRGRQALKKNNSAISVDDQETTIVPLFEMFMQFMKPLVQECKHCADKELSIISEASENRLTELHCMLRSVNETLQSFIQEKIYARTEDTAEGKHYCFLKEIHDAFYSISIKLHFFWLSEGQTGDEVKKILPLIAKEIIVGVGSFLEIEYRVFGDDLIIIWLMLLSYLAATMSFTDTKPCSLLISSILNVGCKLINVYSELRQVNIPLFALCKAVRFLINNSNNANVTLTGEYNVYSSTFLSSQQLLKAVQYLLSSQNFRLTIINSINSMPEGQAGNCIQQLNLDITDALEWIKQNSFSVDRKSLSEAKKTNISMLDMDIQTEVLGMILSEIYATVLESLSITSTNSILIGNSLKSLIKTLSLTLGCLLQAQSNNINDFVFSITGQNSPNSEFIECVNSSQVELQSVCWLFLFFFRLYASARSLYRQLISLMPPDISHKASEALGDLFTASCYMDWVERPEKMDGGYFSWVAKSSLSLPEVIKIISEDYLLSSFAGYAPLVYMLLVITVQRLSDLNRLIKAIESIHTKDVSVVQMQSQGDTFARRSKKQWKQLIAGSRKEATELTNFISGHLSLFDSMDPHGQFDCDGKTNFAYEGQWNCGISSLDEKSLPVAVWWLLCQSIDVWCVHFTKKHIKIFFSYLFLYSLPNPSNQKVDGKKKGSICHTVTLHNISLHFLEDTISYEEMTTYTNVSARYCDILKKLASPILLRTAPTNLNLGSLPNWVELLNVLEKGPVIINADHQLVLNDSSLSGSVSAPPRMIFLEHRMSPQFSSFSMELKACENLLNLFCKMPRFYGNTKSFLRYAAYMLNIERVLVSNLLNPSDETLSYEPFQLLKLFVSCRRAMKSLVMGFNKNSGARELSPICAVFNCSSSILWLFKSVYKVAELSTAYFGQKDSNLVQDMIYFLIDHTSYVFLKISEAKANTTFLFLLKKTVNKAQISQNHHSLNGNDCTPKSFEPCNDWEHVELIAETLKEHAEEFLVTVKSCDHSVKLDAFCNTEVWSKFSCVISCFQALLLGLTSASDSLVLEMPIENRKISNFMLSCVSKLSSNIEVFDNLLNLCLNVLILGDSQVTKDISIANYDSLISDRVERTMKLFTPINMTKISCCQTEHAKKDDATMRIKVNSFESSSGPSNEKDEPEASTVGKQRSQASHLKLAIDFFHIVNTTDFEKFKISSESLVQSLLEDTSLQTAFILRQLFITSAAILRIKCIPSRGKHLKNQPYNGRSILCSTVNFYGASCLIFQGFSEMICQPCLLSFALLDGVLTFFDAVWNLFCFVDLDVSKDVYTHLIDLYLKTMGKCISLQGKTSTLFSRDIEADTKLLEPQNEMSWKSWRFLGHGRHGFSNFKTMLRLSFKKYTMISSDVYLKTAICLIEEKLAGVRADYPAIYQLITGNVNGGAVSSDSAASIECYELILDCFPGQNQYLRESMPNIVGAIINIVLHLQNPSIFYTDKLFSDKSMVHTNAGAVIRMCIEVLTKVVGRRSFHMGSCYVSQYFHIPTVLFVKFYKLSSCIINSSSIFSCNEEKTCLSGRKLHMVDHQFFVELYTSCCRLMCSTIKHRKSETVLCIHLLEESISTLLSCLVAVDSDIAKKEGCFSLNLGDALKCANFLRRIYEEIRQQKDALGKYASLLLSNYISIYSGCGPYKAGIKREIDEAIRPGVYSLIDICTRADLQQLHNLLSEGPCRSTLSILLHDYQQNFQYEGKI